MIRFIDLRNQGTGYRFAFWSTVFDKFCEFSGEQVWETKEEFIDHFKQDSDYGEEDLERYTGLMPSWVSEPNKEEDAFYD